MKKLTLVTLIALFSFTYGAFVVADKNAVQPPVFVYSCEDAVLKGCVGECGQSYSDMHIVTKEDIKQSRFGVALFCVQSVANSLCPNTAAYFELTKNGLLVSKGDLTAGDKGFVAGEVGDVIGLDVKLVAKDNEIICIRQGQTDFKMGHLKLHFK